jgi:succinate dehydrogenase / fumarate reductase flavoprotein subunit
VPMKIFPSVHYSMGGLYTVYEQEKRQPVPGDTGEAVGMKLGAPNNMMTNIPGLYAFGEVNYQYHGGTRLGANALLNCIFDGLFCGLSVFNYANEQSHDDLSDALASKYVNQEQSRQQKLIDSDGDANPYDIHRRLGEEMTDSCTVVRTEERMEQAYSVLSSLKAEYRRVRLSDTGMWTNQNLSFTRALGDMLIYGEAILASAIKRKESRGSHYRPDYPDRIDDPFQKTTIAKYDAANDKPAIEYEDVPTPLVPPRARTYGKIDDKTEAAAAK